MDASEILICSLIAISTFLFWEFVAWFTHKYVMHGFLWVWHKSHHSVHNHLLEKNDWFAVVFSVPAIALFIISTTVFKSAYLFSVAIGIVCYGLFYLIFHDVIVHQRLKWRPKKRSKYLSRMINAHYIHHSKHSKENGEAFGFLIVPKKYEVTNKHDKKDSPVDTFK
ncbi:MAG: sterol desaturase family protein [Cyclobacteriaceae bacterium]|jgi:beta-carotene 3-hydroxylase|nr:sterol desaturase family protein [Cyclobacteriaceae bacterium]MDH4295055.1 sterol desaturase family protein [Cyclobacteriaceae bacterium]MDH5249786.1 sterol desaturase family protein [Cyclobacteriaceae bacterium]